MLCHSCDDFGVGLPARKLQVRLNRFDVVRVTRIQFNPSMNRRKRILRWVGRIAGGLASLALALVCVEHFRGAHALKVRISEMKANGEKLSISEFEPPRGAIESNAAVALFQLTNQISDVYSNFAIMPPAGRFASPGKAVVAWQLDRWASGKESNSWMQLGSRVDQSATLLKAIHDAVQKPGWHDGFDYQKGFVDFQMTPLVPLKQAAQILNVAAVWKIRSGRTDHAVEQLSDALALLQRQKEARLLISQLVRLACVAITWNSTWQALQTNIWSESQLATLQQGWERMDLANDMAVAMETERAMTLDFHAQISASRAMLKLAIEKREQADELMGEEFASLPSRGFVLRWIHVPLWRFAWFDQDALRAVNRWQAVIETDREARTKSWNDAKNQADRLDHEVYGWFADPVATNAGAHKQNAYDRWRFLLSNDSFSVGQTLLLKAIKAETQRRMIVVAIALERFRLRNGRLPGSLAELSPDFLTAVPLDGMDGKPLRYQLKPDGTFLLYSVGEDGRDDGGDSSRAEGKEFYHQIWDGKDASWPSAASPLEAEKAVSSE